MPIYEYITASKGCEYCSRPFELSQSMQDEPLRRCPRCGGPVRKLISRFCTHKHMLSNDRLRELGFRKFESRHDGSFERTA